MNSTPYSLFVDKCEEYKIQVEVKESVFDELRLRFEHFPINDLLDWLWANGKKKVTTMRIINWMKKSKDFARRDIEKKQEVYKLENEVNESKRLSSMKKKDEEAREKSRKIPKEIPEEKACPEDPRVVQWVSSNKKFIPLMLQREEEREKKEHPYSRMLSPSVLRGIAKGRLIRLIKENI